MDRDEIRKLAECHGFWAHEIWWKQNIPRFDGMISEVQEPLLKRISALKSKLKCDSAARDFFLAER